MATFTESTTSQGTYETRKWTADFTNDLPSGGSVTAGTAYHVPPSGSASTPTVNFTSTSVTAQLTGLSVTGNHYIDIVATYSNGESSQMRIAFPVVYPTVAARSGILDIINELRGMAEAGVSEYSIAGVHYWSDKQLQDVLDLHRTDYRFTQLLPKPITVSGGTAVYYDYYMPAKMFEATDGGTAVFYLQDSTGATAGTSLWSADYRRGVVTFASNTAGTAYYMTGRSYDLEAAAAELWRRKAGHYAPTSFSFSTDNHSVNRESVYKHCLDMAAFWENLGGDSFQSVKMTRSDVY